MKKNKVFTPKNKPSNRELKSVSGAEKKKKSWSIWHKEGERGGVKKGRRKRKKNRRK